MIETHLQTVCLGTLSKFSECLMNITNKHWLALALERTHTHTHTHTHTVIGSSIILPQLFQKSCSVVPHMKLKPKYLFAGILYVFSFLIWSMLAPLCSMEKMNKKTRTDTFLLLCVCTFQCCAKTASLNFAKPARIPAKSFYLFAQDRYQ